MDGKRKRDRYRGIERKRVRKSQGILYYHDLMMCIYHLSIRLNFSACTIPSRSPYPPNYVCSCTSFSPVCCIPLSYSLQFHLFLRFIYSIFLSFISFYRVRQTRHAGHCWRSRDKLISDVLLWTPTYGPAKAGRPAWTYIQQLCEDTGCSPEDLPEAMNDREKWRERVRDIRASSTTWWWWCSQN